MTQLEFYKSFQFVAELLIAEMLFVYKLRRRSYSPLRIIVGIVLCFLFAGLFPIPADNAFYSAFMFFSIFVFSALICKAVFKENWLTIMFCCVAGYITQHLAYELNSLALTVMGINERAPMGFYGSEFSSVFSNPFLTIVYCYIFTVTYYFSYLFFARKIKEGQSVSLNSSFIFFFAIIIMIVVVLLNALVVYYIAADGKPLYMIIVGTYNILCCAIAMYLQFEVALRRRLENSLDVAQRIWHQVKAQYAMSKENIELINLKCHDLKHQIRMFGGDNRLNSSLVKELEDRINIYDSVVKTGNDALDVILTEKSLLCNKNGIKLSCIVDGKHLDFMQEEDIYALFGNIIDNAIEAVLKLETDKRVIGMHVKAVGNLLTIRAYNYHNERLHFENGLPLTTKEDKKFHGYGIKSMQYICSKYGGDISIKTESNVFSVNILFSLDNS